MQDVECWTCHGVAGGEAGCLMSPYRDSQHADFKGFVNLISNIQDPCVTARLTAASADGIHVEPEEA